MRIPTGALTALLCLGIGCCPAGHRGATAFGENLEIQSAFATGYYDPQGLIDLHLSLRLRSPAARPVTVYRIWDAVVADPVEPFVGRAVWINGPRPSTDTAEAIVVTEGGTNIDWTIRNWAGISLHDIRRTPVHAMVRYEYGKIKSKPIRARVHLTKKPTP
jgi:hypothetical protein